MTDTHETLREAVARAMYDADEDAITANVDSNPNLSDEAKRDWHESIGPKVAWEDVHPETREAYLARATAALSLMQPEIDRRVAEERDAVAQWLLQQAGGRPSMFQDRNLSRQIAAREFMYAIQRGDHLTAFQQENNQ